MKNLRAVCSSITGEVRKNNEDNYCFFSRFRPLEQEDTRFPCLFIGVRRNSAIGISGDSRGERFAVRDRDRRTMAGGF